MGHRGGHPAHRRDDHQDHRRDRHRDGHQGRHRHLERIHHRARWPDEDRFDTDLRVRPWSPAVDHDPGSERDRGHPRREVAGSVARSEISAGPVEAEWVGPRAKWGQLAARRPEAPGFDRPLNVARRGVGPAHLTGLTVPDGK